MHTLGEECSSRMACFGAHSVIGEGEAEGPAGCCEIVTSRGEPIRRVRPSKRHDTTL